MVEQERRLSWCGKSCVVDFGMLVVGLCVKCWASKSLKIKPDIKNCEIGGRDL